MTGWVAEGEAPSHFTLDQDLELRSAEKATVRYVKHTLDGEEIRQHIADGKVVTRLAMTWGDRISFLLNENLQIKRLSFLDLLKEQADSQAENEDERFDIDFTLMTGEVAQLLNDLLEGRLPEYKLYVFLNPFHLNDKRRVALHQHLGTGGKTAQVASWTAGSVFQGNLGSTTLNVAAGQTMDIAASSAASKTIAGTGALTVHLLTAADAASAKLFCTEMAGRVIDKCLQLHGGYGYIKEYPVERKYRDCRVFTIYEGTSQVQQMVISGNLLK